MKRTALKNSFFKNVISLLVAFAIMVTMLPSFEVNTAEAAAKTGSDLLSTHCVTGYWHNFNNGTGVIKLKDTPKEYGFEGIDIDFEGSAIAKGDVTYIAKAIREIKEAIGDPFILTMAPEGFYLCGDKSQNIITSAYTRLILAVKDIVTVINVQFYNGGSLLGSNQPGTADYVTSLVDKMIKDGIRADQIGIGVPACQGAAGSGHLSNEKVKLAIDAIMKGGKSETYKMTCGAQPNLRGVMTWSINWDKYSNNYSWAKYMSNLIDSLGGNGGSTYIPEITTTSTPKTTPVVTTKTTPVVTTTSKPGSKYEEWSPTKIYLGDSQATIVVYNGYVFKSTYWTQNVKPDKNVLWNGWEYLGKEGEV